MTGISAKSECEKPNCTKEGTKTYRGENGNTLKLCTRHYYNLVADHNGLSNIPNDSDPLPFWDSGIRCDSSNDDLLSVDWGTTPEDFDITVRWDPSKSAPEINGSWYDGED